MDTISKLLLRGAVFSRVCFIFLGLAYWCRSTNALCCFEDTQGAERLVAAEGKPNHAHQV